MVFIHDDSRQVGMIDVRRRRTTMKRLLLVLAVALIALVGCAQPAPTPTAVEPTSTSPFAQPTPSYSVEVTEDLEYLKVLQSDEPVQKLDVYAPTEPGPWPVVVLHHGRYQTKDNPLYSSFSEELAGRGLVVFVPQRRTTCHTLFECAENNGAELLEVYESWACAIRFARERAADYGGDPESLVVFGHGSAGLETALMGDDLEQEWEEFASNRGGPLPQTECLAAGGSADAETFVAYGGEYDFYEELKDSDPELWEMTDYFALIGRGPSLRMHLVFGELANPANIEVAGDLHEALVDAGYDATVTILPGEKWEIPWEGPQREALVQAILEEARH
jgi:hypothetical protein